jgi:hypothetical protein
MISRTSIDTLKEHFRDDVYVRSSVLACSPTDPFSRHSSKDDWLLIKQLKTKLDIV